METNTTIEKGSRHLLAKIVVTASLAALPTGIVAIPAMAAPAVAVDHPWHQDCDHNGRWQMQEDRGQWQWADCDNGNGHWQQNRDRDGRVQWQWHRDRDDQGPPPPPPAFNQFGGLFGSMSG